jgi:23S rRNA pseudouridine1911/1915/1917 synthase
MTEWVVAAAEGGQRVDRFVAARLGISRHAVWRMLERGVVRVGGKRARKGQRLAAGDRVSTSEAAPRTEDLRPLAEPDAPLTILREDADLVFMAKPPGQPSHPLEPGERGTTANALAARHPECAAASEDPREGGLVHRLDTGTSGVLVAARSREAWQAARDEFRAGRVGKVYVALVAGSPSLDQGTIEAPLLARGKRSVVDPLGRDARTEWQVEERLGERTLLRLRTTTGRMHQVRAHLSHAELPIIGDTLYGGPPEPDLVGHFLHAERLTLRGTEVSAPLPADRAALLAHLRKRD